jgi:hypothetical protein
VKDVIPAKAGICPSSIIAKILVPGRIPSYAGMTVFGLVHHRLNELLGIIGIPLGGACEAADF